jgi:ABC-type bacteriocin/lantibiotic exporter with double-glycine peptidase domain
VRVLPIAQAQQIALARLALADPHTWVAVAEDGVISELGSHDELVAAGASYAALWNSRHGKG